MPFALISSRDFVPYGSTGTDGGDAIMYVMCTASECAQ